jgi:DNA-binding transcriptional regulator PaaX
MSLVFKILKAMYDAELNYKGVKVNGFGIPRFLLKDKNSFDCTVRRLRRQGYITNEEGVWKITSNGKKLVKEKITPLQSFDSPFSNQSKRNLLLIFDIPEPQKVKRDWLRFQLKKFNYKMVQRSVWVGPSPLPREFTNYLKEIKIEKCIKTYKLAKSQNTKIKAN